MHRLARLVSPIAFFAMVLTSFAGGTEGIAIYAGTEKITSVGGGNSNSGDGSSSGKRRQPVYIAVDVNTGDVQRVRYTLRTKKYVVEDAVRFNQVIPQTAGRRSREFVRLMLAKHVDQQPGEFTDISSHYDGRTADSVIDSVELPVAYPRIFKWTFAFQYSGFELAPPGVTTFPQIDTGSAVLSLNKALTRASAGKPLADAINIIIGSLTARRYSAETP